MNLYSSRSHTIFRMVIMWHIYIYISCLNINMSASCNFCGPHGCLLKQIIESRETTGDEDIGTACDAVRVSVLVQDH